MNTFINLFFSDISTLFYEQTFFNFSTSHWQLAHSVSTKQSSDLLSIKYVWNYEDMFEQNRAKTANQLQL